jgi:glutamyl-tRNA reductase
VRTETALGEGAVSISFAAVALARKIFGRLEGRRVLVVGAGEISALTAQHLRSQGAAEIVITNRTAAAADLLASQVAGRAVPWSDMASSMALADIVVTATGSQRPIITRADVEAATGRKRADPLFIIDIAVPRDVDPRAGEIEQVFLYNIDDLQAIVRQNLERRGIEIGRADQIVDEEVLKFTNWQRSRDAVPTIVALRQHFEGIRKAELERLEPKLAALSPDARARVEEITRLMVEKLLLQPTEQLKTAGDAHLVSQYAAALRRLFALEKPED